MDDGSEQDSGGGEEGEREGENDTLGVTTLLDLSSLRVRLPSPLCTLHAIVAAIPRETQC